MGLLGSRALMSWSAQVSPWACSNLIGRSWCSFLPWWCSHRWWDSCPRSPHIERMWQKRWLGAANEEARERRQPPALPGVRAIAMLLSVHGHEIHAYSATDEVGKMDINLIWGRAGKPMKYSASGIA